MKPSLTRIALGITLGAGILGSTLAVAAPASADNDWHGGYQNGYDHRDRDDRHWDARDHRYEQDRDWQRDRGQRYYDRAHGFWRDRLGYWNPRSGVYVQFHF